LGGSLVLGASVGRTRAIRQIGHEEHHIFTTPSILTQLPNFDIIQSFSLDYMHMTNLGITRKLVYLWIQTGPLSVRLTGTKINELSDTIVDVRPFIISEFCRKPREIKLISRWKSTELRLFLIYIYIYRPNCNSKIFIN